MSTSHKAYLAVALLIGGIVGGSFLTLSDTPVGSLDRLLALGAIAAVMTGLGVGASALADYVYGPNTK